MSNEKKEIMRQEISQNISPLTKYLINIGLNLNVFYYESIMRNFYYFCNLYSNLVTYLRKEWTINKRLTE